VNFIPITAVISNSFSPQWRALSQHEAGNNSDHKEADNFSEYIAGCVNTREVPVRNVRCDRGQDPSYNDEADSSGKAANFRLSQKKHCQNRIRQIARDPMRTGVLLAGILGGIVMFTWTSLVRAISRAALPRNY
jgi:hypothetical protein